MHNLRSNWFYVVSIVAFLCLFLFRDLGRFPIFQWDEARYANNSIEVLTLGNWFHFTMDGVLDTWNFKPPLVLWLQAASMRVFGMNEWAVRLPSALASIGIVILLFWFCTSALKSPATGFVSGLFFAASVGFIGPHIGRSADLDAVQTFFLLWYVLLFLKYTLQDQLPRHAFLYLGLLVLLSFLCKGMPGLLLLPYLGIISLLHGNYRKVLLNRSIYVYAGLVLLACAGYYFLRESHDPGYWNLVKKSEFNRFSGEGIGWHVHPVDFYLKNFTEQKRYFFLIYLLPFTLLYFGLAEKSNTKRAFLYLWIIVLGYFLFISIPPVKLEWYDAPFYPLFALIFGIFTHHITHKFIKSDNLRLLGMTAIALALCWPHYAYIWEKIRFSPEKVADFEREGLLMRQLAEQRPMERGYTVLHSKKKAEHLDQIKFYIKAYENERQAHIQIKDQMNEIQPGEKLLIAQNQWADSIHLHFPEAVTLFETAQGRLVQVR